MWCWTGVISMTCLFLRDRYENKYSYVYIHGLGHTHISKLHLSPEAVPPSSKKKIIHHVQYFLSKINSLIAAKITEAKVNRMTHRKTLKK